MKPAPTNNRKTIIYTSAPTCAKLGGMNIQEVRAMPIGQKAGVIGIVKSVEEKTSQVTFLILTISDKTGLMDVRVFSSNPNFTAVKALKPNDIICVTGTTSRFKENFSFEFSSYAKVPIEGVNLSDLVAEAPEGEKVLRAEFNRLMSGRPKELQAWVQKIVDDMPEFFTGPGAFALHHAYRCGLLEHSVHVAKIVERLLILYPEVNPDIAIAGALLHDIGKAKEFCGMVPTHTTEGHLYGHLALGLMIVSKYPDNQWKEEILHIIASHYNDRVHTYTTCNIGLE